jgi:hypothetical protein
MHIFHRLLQSNRMEKDWQVAVETLTMLGGVGMSARFKVGRTYGDQRGREFTCRGYSVCFPLLSHFPLIALSTYKGSISSISFS